MIPNAIRRGSRAALALDVFDTLDNKEVTDEVRLVLAIVSNGSMEPFVRDSFQTLTTNLAKRPEIKKAIQEEFALLLTNAQLIAREADIKEVALVDSEDDIPDLSDTEDVSPTSPELVLDGRINRLFKETWKNRNFETLRSTVTVDNFIQSLFQSTQRTHFTPTAVDQSQFFDVYGQLRTGVGSQLCIPTFEKIFLDPSTVNGTNESKVNATQLTSNQGAEEPLIDTETKPSAAGVNIGALAVLRSIAHWLVTKVKQILPAGVPSSQACTQQNAPPVNAPVSAPPVTAMPTRRLLTPNDFTEVCFALATVSVVLLCLKQLGVNVSLRQAIARLALMC